ncbi:hypothetical protein ABT324_24710 [Saccharopolyspora sp. NPDC000359]|uniref:hypothetical protein n=1 Tax=Saccharopolyspora sp. NPDC000359 TaxID=3154251 RepID=UPI00331C4A59
MRSSKRRFHRYSIIAVVSLVLAGGGYFWFMHQQVTEPVGIPTGGEPRREPISPNIPAPGQETLIKLHTSSEKGCGGEPGSGNRRCEFGPEWGLDGSDERELVVDYLDFSRGLEANEYLDAELEDHLEVELAAQLDEFDTVEGYLAREMSAGLDPVLQAERYLGWARGAHTLALNNVDLSSVASSTGAEVRPPDPDEGLTELAGPWDQAYLYEWNSGDRRVATLVFRKGTQVVEVEYSGSDKTYWFWQDEVRMPADEARDGVKAAAVEIAAKL